MSWTKGKKQTLIDSVKSVYKEKGIDISENLEALNGLSKMNEKQLETWEELINQLSKLGGK